MARVVLSAVLGAIVALALGSAVLATHGNGGINGRDLASWPGGDDNPNDDQGTYAYGNYTHDSHLEDWNEPAFDYFRDQSMYWSSTAEQLLNQEASTRMLVFEQDIQTQWYYNYTGYRSTSLPHTGVPEAENGFEELLQGRSEVDMELRDTSRINTGTYYFYTLVWDSENVIFTAPGPLFWSEVEWELLGGGGIRFDKTGQFRKMHVVP